VRLPASSLLGTQPIQAVHGVHATPSSPAAPKSSALVSQDQAQIGCIRLESARQATGSAVRVVRTAYWAWHDVGLVSVRNPSLYCLADILADAQPCYLRGKKWPTVQVMQSTSPQRTLQAQALGAMAERNDQATSTGAAERTDPTSTTKGSTRLTYDLRVGAGRPAPRSHSSEPGSFAACSTCKNGSGLAVRGRFTALAQRGAPAFQHGTGVVTTALNAHCRPVWQACVSAVGQSLLSVLSRSGTWYQAAVPPPEGAPCAAGAHPVLTCTVDLPRLVQ